MKKVKLKSKNFDAIQWDGGSAIQIVEFCEPLCSAIRIEYSNKNIHLNVPGETLLLQETMWLVKDDKGRFWVLDSTEYEERFEEI